MAKKIFQSAPNSKESEMMVLGCMLSSYNSLNVAVDSLDNFDFYYKEHSTIFNAIRDLYKKDKPADIHIVSEKLKNENLLEDVGGVGYLTTLAQYTSTSTYIDEYIKIVKEKAILRKMIEASEKIIKSSLRKPEEVQVILDEAQANFFKISQKANASFGISLKELLSGIRAKSKLPYLQELQDRQEQFQEKGNLALTTGISTHFADLDKLINGLNPSNLMILASRPAMGKTALSLNIAENVCFKNKKSVGIFSLEMTAEQLLHRIICSQAEVESEKIKTGALDGLEYQRVVSTANKISSYNMIIDDHPGLKITDIRARARRMKESYNIDFLIIDYLQLVSGSGTLRSQENRQNEISEISRMLKNLARELDIPLLCLSQLSRRVEERQGHRPLMSDLRESGCLSGDTLIQDVETKKTFTIKELCENKKLLPIKIFATDTKKIEKHNMIKAFYSGKKMLYKLTTKENKSIKATLNHPFLKKEGWTPLEKLKIKDEIAIYKDKKMFFDEITSIEKLQEEDVYDATVENVHNFLANDIIVHNSIEQDSDIVMFLLRREYYDPYDKPGHAELIVAKNRHGSVGSVDLTFRKELAQFANYANIEG